MVVLFYRCETDDREVTLNDEHDDCEWVAPETAGERVAAVLGERGRRVVERAAALGGDGAAAGGDGAAALGADGPFAPLEDPYEGTAVDTEELLEELADAREMRPEELRAEYE